MSDLRFDDIVQTQRCMGDQGRYVVSTCTTCSTQREVNKSEFKLDDLFNLDGSNVVPEEVDADLLEYVASMRGWQCCHSGEEPLDGFPEEPETDRIKFSQ